MFLRGEAVSSYGDFDDDIPSDVREEMYEERRARARYRHWCEECHGYTGAGSPCAPDDEE